MSNFILEFLNEQLAYTNIGNNDETEIEEEQKNKEFEKNNDKPKKSFFKNSGGKSNRNSGGKSNRNSEKKNNSDNENIEEKYEDNGKTQELESSTSKQLSGYLGGDSKLSESMSKMNNGTSSPKKGDENEKSKKGKNKSKEEIKITKEKKYKSLIFIFIEFLVGITLIFVSYLYLSNNNSEYKFIKSSITLWQQTFKGFLNDLGIGENTKEKYIEKRADLIVKLNQIELLLENCSIEKNIDLSGINNNIQVIKNELLNIEHLSLDKFIEKYQNYSNQVTDLKKKIIKKCE